MQHNQHKCRMRHQNVATNGMTITSWVGVNANCCRVATDQLPVASVPCPQSALCLVPANLGNLQIEKLQIIYNLAQSKCKVARMTWRVREIRCNRNAQCQCQAKGKCGQESSVSWFCAPAVRKTLWPSRQLSSISISQPPTANSTSTSNWELRRMTASNLR